jgi:hypothetical protein
MANYYPCIIEVKYDGPDINTASNDVELISQLLVKRTEFYSKRISQILSLLTVFTIYHFKMPSGEQFWYNDGTINKLIFPIYIINNLESESDSFSKIISPTEMISDKNYLISFQDKFVLPSNLDTLFDLFFESPDVFSEKFYKSVKLYHIARNIYYESISLSFAAFISSIETLAQYHFQENKICEECHQPQFSSTNKFKKFLLTFGTGQYLDKKFVEKIYKWRSNMLHTGDLFIWELERMFSPENPNYNKREDESKTLLMVYFYVRVALVNFLLQESKSKSDQVSDQK